MKPKIGKIIKGVLIVLFIVSIIISIFTLSSEESLLSEFGEDKAMTAVSVIVLPFIIFVGLLGQVVPLILIVAFCSVIIKLAKGNKTTSSKEQTVINGNVINGSNFDEYMPPPIEEKYSEVHTSKGSELDAFYREKTGESLHDDDCETCESMEPWDAPKKVGLFGRLFSKRDNDQDDVEEYYRSRGIKHDKR